MQIKFDVTISGDVGTIKGDNFSHSFVGKENRFYCGDKENEGNIKKICIAIQTIVIGAK